MRVLQISRGLKGPQMARIARELPKFVDELRGVHQPTRSALDTVRLIWATAMAQISFRPNLVVIGGDTLATLPLRGLLRVPYVVADSNIPDTTAPPAVRRARAIIVDRWSAGRALAERFGVVRVVTVAAGVDLTNHPLADREGALAALGLPAYRMLGVIARLDDSTRLDLLQGIYRDFPGVGLLVAADGPRADLLQAISATTRPSAPVVCVGEPTPATRLVTAAAATIGVDLHREGPGPGAIDFLLQGRRLVTIAGPDATPLLDLYSPLHRAVHVVRPTVGAVRAGIAAALEAQAHLGPLPPEAVEEARAALDRSTWAQRIADVLHACV